MQVPNLKKELSTEELKNLGLKSGIEIHQQLEGKKLFCNCPTTVRDDTPDFKIKRYLRASAGESGKIDAAALAETKKQKYYEYEGYNDTTCLVELDEEPPGEVNQEALSAILQIAKLCKMQVVDQLRFMRKTVVNGSNTSAFQRTGLVALNGKLPGHDVGVESLLLEEEACKEIEKNNERTIYNLSRLGIPLIEIATAPDMNSPEQIAEVSEYIGMMLRSLKNVKRGLGTIRQDVNISIRDGVRVELKGVQDLKSIATIAHHEALRQYNLLEIFKTLKERKASVKGEDGKIHFQPINALKTTSSEVIKSGLQKPTGVVYGAKLSGFAGIIGLEIQAGRRYGSELSDYAKVMGVKGLFHSDELPNYGITEEEKQAIFLELECNPEEDAFIIIADKEEIAKRAMFAALERAADFNLRKEVRSDKQGGASSFMRPMPGASRMYPETDVKPLFIDMSEIEVPILLSEKIKDLEKTYGIAPDIAKRVLRDGLHLKDLHASYPDIKISFILDTYYGLPGTIKKKHGLDVDMLIHAPSLLQKLQAGEITKDSFTEILLLLAQEKPVDYSLFMPVSIDSLREEITKIVLTMKDAPLGAIIGKVMGTYKGQVDGKILSDLVRELVNQ